MSTDEVVTVNCSFAPARLGTVVSAPGVVGVRGTGQAYDGLYYLKSATHQISLLADDGLGLHAVADDDARGNRHHDPGPEGVMSFLAP